MICYLPQSREHPWNVYSVPFLTIHHDSSRKSNKKSKVKQSEDWRPFEQGCYVRTQKLLLMFPSPRSVLVIYLLTAPNEPLLARPLASHLHVQLARWSPSLTPTALYTNLIVALFPLYHSRPDDRSHISRVSCICNKALNGTFRQRWQEEVGNEVLPGHPKN